MPHTQTTAHYLFLSVVGDRRLEMFALLLTVSFQLALDFQTQLTQNFLTLLLIRLLLLLLLLRQSQCVSRAAARH